MPVRIQPVQVKGLAELTNDLRRFSADTERAVEDAAFDSASRISRLASARVPLGPGIGGHARDSIKAAKERGGARVDAGGPRFPYYPWLDFGGTIRKGTKKPVRRKFFKEGRYVWAVYGQQFKKIQEDLTKALVDIARAAGLNPKE